MADLSVWVCLSKTGTTLVFSDEPKMENGEWSGNLYVNSSMYGQIERLIKQSSMTHQSQPEQITFKVTKCI